jgi:ADP-ribosylglycohydrolase
MHMQRESQGRLRCPQRRRSPGGDAEEVRRLGGPGLRRSEMRYRGDTRDAVAEALDVPSDATIVEAAQALGNGSGVTAPDTVPLCLWVVAHASPRAGFEQALWHTVGALGDRDTTCAIVGGVLALTSGPDGIPQHWLQSREALPIGLSASRSTSS